VHTVFSVTMLLEIVGQYKTWTLDSMDAIIIWTRSSISRGQRSHINYPWSVLILTS